MVEEQESTKSQIGDINSLANKKVKKTVPKEKEKDGQKSNKNETERNIDEHPLAENSVVIVEYGGKECFAHIKDIETMENVNRNAYRRARANTVNLSRCLISAHVFPQSSQC